MKKQILVFIIVILALFVGMFRSIPAADTVDALPSIPLVDCSIMPPPVLGYEISRGQDPNDVIDFINDMSAQGYSVGSVDIVSEGIEPCVDVLIVHGLAQNSNLSGPYADVETELIREWVIDGHGLMLASDHTGFKDYTLPLFQEFGYNLLGGILRDPTDFEQGSQTDPSSWVIYQTDNFAAHPILNGISSLQFQASSWLGSVNNAIVTADADAIPASVPVMAAFLDGDGCVTMSTDSNWYATDDGSSAYHKQENAQVARRAVAWLNGCEMVLTAVSGGPYIVNEGSTITLDGSHSFDPNNQTLTFTWDLDNDGQYDDAMGATVPFSAASLDDNIFPISLRVANNSETVTHNSTITVQNVAPAVSRAADLMSVQVGTAVTFNGSFTDPGIQDTHDLLWGFGDGSAPATDLPEITHSFDQPGTYIITLTITDDDGGVGQASVEIEVWIPGSVLYLPLVANNHCALQFAVSDVILAIDSSLSMLNQTEPSGPTKLSAAQEAAVSFLDLLDFNSDQAGVVSFDETAVLRHPLSTNQSSLVTAVNSLEAHLYTRIDLALIQSHEELIGPRHHVGSNRVIILLTDGVPAGAGETAVVDAADDAKTAGIKIYTIGLGQDVNATLLQTVATTSNYYYFAPSTADLEAIYAQIATNLPCAGG